MSTIDASRIEKVEVDVKFPLVDGHITIGKQFDGTLREKDARDLMQSARPVVTKKRFYSNRRDDNRVTIQQMAPISRPENTRVLTVAGLTEEEHSLLAEVCQKVLVGLRGD